MFQNIVDIIVPVRLETRGYSTDKLEYSSACPYCKGGRDRFRLWPNQGTTGRFWCRKCNVKGTGRKFVEDFLSNSQNKLVTDFLITIKNTVPFKVLPSNNFPVERKTWSNRAGAILDFYCKHMVNRHCLVSELKQRRIFTSTIKQFRLGYVANHIYENASEWGYSNDGEIGKKIYLPSGILIPRYLNDALAGLKVRMDEPRDGRRYHLVRGSYPGPILLSGKNRNILCVVESELDGILLAQECSDLIDVCVLGTAMASVADASIVNLWQYEKVIVCLDNDHAGYKAFLINWRRVHGNVIYWVPEIGKDIGEASKAGCDIRGWIEAGVKYDSILRR